MPLVLPDPRHIVSVHEIVAKAARFEDPKPEYDHSLPIGVDDFPDHETTLGDLAQWAAEVELDLTQARRANPRDEEKISELEKDLQQRHEQLERATQILVALKTEAERLSGVAKAQSVSELELVSSTNGPESAKFTTYSVHAWLKEQFGLDVPEWAPPEAPQAPESVTQMRVDGKKTYELIVAGLITLFLERDPGNKYGTVEQPNAAQVGEAIAEALIRLRVPEDALSTKTIKNKLGESLATWRRFRTEK